MAHPDALMIAHLAEAFQERAFGHNLDVRTAKLAMIRCLHPPAKLRAHGLLAIADAQHRHACLEDIRVSLGAVLPARRMRGTRKDDGLGAILLHELRIGAVIGMDLAIDAALAQAPCDKLGHLTAEIDNQGAFVFGCSAHGERLAEILARGEGVGGFNLTLI